MEEKTKVIVAPAAPICPLPKKLNSLLSVQMGWTTAMSVNVVRADDLSESQYK